LSRVPLLEYENKVLSKINGEKGFPTIQYFGVEGDYICMVNMENLNVI
jgi:hypothetical protein